MERAREGVDSLFTNIVYRLDCAEDSTPRVKWKSFWISAGLLGFTFLLSIVIRHITSGEVLWVETNIHSLIESYCAIMSSFIAYIIYREYRSSGRRSNLYLFLGFFSIGAFDMFHAYSNHSLILFVWFHSLSAFSGAAFFLWSAIAVKRNTRDPQWLRYVFVLFGATITVGTGVALSKLPPPLPYPSVMIDTFSHIPVDVRIMGGFSLSTLMINSISAYCFLSAGVIFLRHFNHTGDLLFHIFSISAFLLFESEFLFVFSRLWDPTWWFWHFIKLLIFLGLLIG
ncbi:MAG TPA: hypothetical protein VF790_04715, partial [Dissulfurispiraceae bacterium]